MCKVGYYYYSRSRPLPIIFFLSRPNHVIRSDFVSHPAGFLRDSRDPWDSRKNVSLYSATALPPGWLATIVTGLNSVNIGPDNIIRRLQDMQKEAAVMLSNRQRQKGG